MLFLEYFQWWYGAGWQQAVKTAIGLVRKVELSFSISVLLRTLFAPWKMIVTNPGRSLDEKFRAMLDNLVSRTVGFFVRIFSLITAVILMVGATAVGLIIVFFWPLIPALIVISAFKAVV